LTGRGDFRELSRGAYIYLLRERGRDEVRYVGQTSGPRRRFNGHLAAARAYLRDLGTRRQPVPEDRQLALDLPRADATQFRCVRPPRNPSKLVEWIASRIDNAESLEMRVVERVACSGECECWPGASCARAGQRETFWIDHLRLRGHRLFNRQRPSG